LYIHFELCFSVLRLKFLAKQDAQTDWFHLATSRKGLFLFGAVVMLSTQACQEARAGCGDYVLVNGRSVHEYRSQQPSDAPSSDAPSSSALFGFAVGDGADMASRPFSTPCSRGQCGQKNSPLVPPYAPSRILTQSNSEAIVSPAEAGHGQRRFSSFCDSASRTLAGYPSDVSRPPQTLSL